MEDYQLTFPFRKPMGEVFGKEKCHQSYSQEDLTWQAAQMFSSIAKVFYTISSLPDLDIPAFSYHDDDLSTMDKEPAPIESANSGGDSDSDGHVLLTVQHSHCITSKVARVCQNCWGSGHQELVQEDDPSGKMDTDGKSLGYEETDNENTNW